MNFSSILLNLMRKTDAFVNDSCVELAYICSKLVIKTPFIISKSYSGFSKKITNKITITK